MQTDRTTKILLGLIALALFLNAAVPLIQPTEVMAEEAQRGPRGRGNVQGNVQSLGQQQAQAAQEERERELNNPGTETDTDKWLRLIRGELNIGYTNELLMQIRGDTQDLALLVDYFGNQNIRFLLEQIRTELQAIERNTD